MLEENLVGGCSSASASAAVDVRRDKDGRNITYFFLPRLTLDLQLLLMQIGLGGLGGRGKRGRTVARFGMAATRLW